MRRIYLVPVALWLCITASAQTIEDVLRDVAQNNKVLQAQVRSDEAAKLAVTAENVPDDPEVEYNSFYNRETTGQAASELIVTQGFDFPTLYGRRSREGRERKAAIDLRREALRRDLLWEAKCLCLDLIHYNKTDGLLQLRRKNADELLAVYEDRLKAGDATQIDVNKIKMERMSLQTEILQNTADHRTALQALLALNGNMPLTFEAQEYPVVVVTNDFDALRDELMAGEVELQAAEAEARAAGLAVSVNRQKWIPHLALGYHRNATAGAPTDHGLVVGASIPLYSNRKQVKMARAESVGAQLTCEDVRLKAEAELHSQFNEVQQLRRAMEVYDMTLLQETLDLLKEAVDRGEMPVETYFEEADGIYSNMQSFMELENRYQKAVAELYKNRL